MGPPCKHAFVEETKEVCHIEPEKVCETKTRTYKVITGYEDGECKEIEVCKFPGFHHGKRPAPTATLSARRRPRRCARRSPSWRRRPRSSRSVTWSLRRCARRRPSRCPPSIARRRRRRNRETLPMLQRNAIRVVSNF